MPRPLANLDLPFAPQVAKMSTLEQVVSWALQQSPPIVIDTVVTQDEYTLDVIVPWSEQIVLVFDTT